jgi:hypothetical protein
MCYSNSATQYPVNVTSEFSDMCYDFAGLVHIDRDVYNYLYFEEKKGIIL